MVVLSAVESLETIQLADLFDENRKPWIADAWGVTDSHPEPVCNCSVETHSRGDRDCGPVEASDLASRVAGGIETRYLHLRPGSYTDPVEPWSGAS